MSRLHLCVLPAPPSQKTHRRWGSRDHILLFESDGHIMEQAEKRSLLTKTISVAGVFALNRLAPPVNVAIKRKARPLTKTRGERSYFGLRCPFPVLRFLL